MGSFLMALIFCWRMWPLRMMLAPLIKGLGYILEVRGNSRLVISGSQFMTNTAQNTGGGFEIEVYDGSQVTH